MRLGNVEERKMGLQWGVRELRAGLADWPTGILAAASSGSKVNCNSLEKWHETKWPS